MTSGLLAALVFCGLIILLFAALVYLSSRVTHNRRYLSGRGIGTLGSRSERRESDHVERKRKSSCHTNL